MGYDLVEEHGYTRKATNLKQSPLAAHVVHPGVHRVASLLKRWLLGTHQGSVDPDHLQAYLEEFTFLFNRRHARHRGLVFHRLLEQLVATGPVRYDELMFGYWPKAAATKPTVKPGTIRTLVITADRSRSRLVERVDKDPRFARIGRATTPLETLHQAKGLNAQLVLIDGDRDGDLIEVVTQARASGKSRIIVVHLGAHTTATADELAAAGADRSVKKAARPGVLNEAAELVEDPDVPF